MATPNYDINYDDKRFVEVESDKKEALTDIEEMYGKENPDGTYTGGMIGNSDKYFQDQIDAVDKWEEKQKELQQKQTDFAIQEIEQQKAQAQKDYTREQSGAYVDWQKQSNQHGVNAEQMAAQGLTNSGYSESAQVSMYNTYQNRVATARESYNLAVQNYNNSIEKARLQNNSVLAQIAYEALQQQLALSLQGFQYKNTLIIEKANKKAELEKTYHDRWKDVLAQINEENKLAESVRQHNENLAEEQRQFDILNPPKTTATINKSSGDTSYEDGSSSNGKKSWINETAKTDDGKTINETPKFKPAENPPIDTANLKEIGLLGSTAPYIYGLVKEGRLEEYVEDGKTKFRWKVPRSSGGASGIKLTTYHK